MLFAGAGAANTLLPKERYGESLSGCGSNTQPSNWEADTTTEVFATLKLSFQGTITSKVN